MKNSFFLPVAGLGLALIACGCNTNPGLTNSKQPGPAAGQAVGYGAGLVVGNAAGAVVGVGEGAAAGVAAPFKPAPVSEVKEYRTTVGPNGQVYRVPVETAVDQYGRPVNPPPPAPPANGTNSVPPPKA